jgi:hypothetical protein
VDWQQLVNLLVLFDERMNESSGLGDITAARLQPSDQSAFFAARALLPAPAIQQPPITSPPPILATSLQRLRASSLLNSLPSPLCIVAHLPWAPQHSSFPRDLAKCCSHHRDTWHDTECRDSSLSMQPAQHPCWGTAISPYRPDWCSQRCVSWTWCHAACTAIALRLSCAMPITTDVMVTLAQAIAGARHRHCLPAPSRGGQDVAITNVLYVPG